MLFSNVLYRGGMSLINQLMCQRRYFENGELERIFSEHV